MRNGMTREEAMRAITSIPAHICEIDNRVGKIEKGMDGDLVIWEGNPPDIDAKPRVVLCNGRYVD